MHPPDRPAYGLFQTAPPYLRAALADTFRPDLQAPPPPTRRVRAARHVGQAGWRVGYTVAQAGRVLERTGDRLIDAGDWLAARVAGRR